MTHIKEYHQVVKDDNEMRELEHFIATKGGQILNIIDNRTAAGVTVRYRLVINKTSD